MPGVEDEVVMAVLKIQCAFRGRAARRKTAARQGKANKWIENYDPQSGCYYYCPSLDEPRLSTRCFTLAISHLS